MDVRVQEKITSFLKCCETAESTELLFEACEQAFRTFGVTGTFYHYIPHLAAHNYKDTRVTFRSKRKQAWIEYYLSKFAKTRDPIQAHCLTTGQAVWINDLSTVPAFQSGLYKEYLDMAQKYVGNGYAVPAFGMNGSRAMFFLQVPGENAVCDYDLLAMFEYLCFAMMRRHCELVTRNNPIIYLTNRERDVLQHMPLGRSNREIAESLNISPNTVNDYVKRLFLKLDAPDRMTASLRAMSLNLID